MLKDISIQEAQDVAFELFKCFDALCREHELTYYLSGGTLLGAVRHKGFIPWDDDMDVMMPRPDYERLLRLELKLPGHIQLFACETDEAYFYPFAKLSDMRYKLHFAHHVKERSIGMSLDIFPIEGLPDDVLRMKLYFKRMQLLNVLRNAALRQDFLPDERFQWIKRLLNPIVRRRGAHHYAMKMNGQGRGIGFGTSAHAGVAMITHYGCREYMPREVFVSGTYLPFCGLDCPVPALYDVYLTQLYGDYMKLPPEHERKTDHGNFTIELRDE